MGKSRYDLLARILRLQMLTLFQRTGLWGVDALRRHARRVAREDGVDGSRLVDSANNTLSNFLSILKPDGSITTARNFTFAALRMCRCEIASISITYKMPDGELLTITTDAASTELPPPVIPGKRHPPLEPEDPADA